MNTFKTVNFLSSALDTLQDTLSRTDNDTTEQVCADAIVLINAECQRLQAAESDKGEF